MCSDVPINGQLFLAVLMCTLFILEVVILPNPGSNWHPDCSSLYALAAVTGHPASAIVLYVGQHPIAFIKEEKQVLSVSM